MFRNRATKKASDGRDSTPTFPGWDDDGGVSLFALLMAGQGMRR